MNPYSTLWLRVEYGFVFNRFAISCELSVCSDQQFPLTQDMHS